MNRDLFVSGTGTISGIGKDTPASLDSLRSGKSGISDIDLLPTSHKGSFKVGEVKFDNRELARMAGVGDADLHRFTRTTLLGVIAVQEAISSAGIQLDDGLKTGLISATTVGGMDKTELEYSKSSASPDFIFSHPCGDSTEKIAEITGVKDYYTTISTACSSGANAIMHGAKMIQQGYLDRVVAGGVDALSLFTLNGFNSLMILDPEYCRPFDQNRQGLNLGEGAGFIVLESAKAIEKRKGKALCRLTGYANANDAYHQTASSPDGQGAWLAMTQALELAGLSPENIDYINVHGTGTSNNDQSEGIAIQRIFGDQVPSFSSTKSFTGHTLGAAAGLEAVYSVLSIQHHLIYPNLRFETPIEELNLVPETKLITDQKIQHVLSNSFGFGGNNSTLIFSR